MTVRGVISAGIFVIAAMCFSLNIALAAIGSPSLVLWFLTLLCFVYLIYYINFFLSEHGKIIFFISRSLKKCGIYSQNNQLILLPSVSWSKKDDIYRIKITDMQVRKKLEKYLDFFSSSLPSGYQVIDCFFDNDEHFLNLIIEKSSNENRLIFSSVSDVKNLINKTDKYSLFLDKKNKISFLDNPHFLIVGGTGSGKSYAASLIAAELLMKNWDIYIFDIKRSYGIFSSFCNCAFSKDDILHYFKKLNEFVIDRQNKLETEINETKDFNLILPDPALIVIEELTALLSSLDKKEKESFLAMLSTLVMIGRQLNIHLLIVMQVSSADTLPSSIKANCAPIALGNLPETIQKTAFGVSSKISHHHFERGEGLMCLDGVRQIHVYVPSLNIPLFQLLVATASARKAVAD